ncbi:MAG: phenylalanine--tRNA ligase subunit alpha [Elusimicrobia bacterium GWA2_56_46]|nr:MAG: phenylalanine--tRNA ligase subunit alpha [Elusimicrobia bacterium GWA2_56_46]OGR56278.1 MAG: phenylalanine--tRNA ligase subunit alpha [Elusimicrobia bacterium GWC2_56_31]HBB67536.1 phenylalanine--tRNA ligase subunit alpha [Elusimicrobiota bacterium]HBW22468.1 phenylalanine--tRNA ligase subunit alpha [Elusimicrobiota bacterium]
MNQDDWKARLALIRDGSLSALGKTDAAGLAEFETHYLGRKGELTLLLRDLKDFPVEERKILGALGNALKTELSAALDVRKAETGAGAADLKKSRLDLTLAGYPFPQGSLHPLTVTANKMCDGFQKLGFSIADGPLIEEDYFNFEALNFAPDHPARDMQDTFYVDLKDAKGGDLLLRTHTSPVQIRAMKSQEPPLRVVSAGRVFRSEAVDASHSFVFHQLEGFYVDRNVTMADLKWTLEAFMKDLFGSQAKVSFSPSFFPFVEPGAQVAVSCVFCKGSGACPVCKGTGWLELLGAGVIHPNVIKGCGYDPEKWSGFAFGAGIERFAMLLYGIRDMRMLYENDLRILKQIQ